MTDVAIIGAGPVGLDLANRLRLGGHTVTILDARPAIGRHSRSIGIHAPSLEVLSETGVTEALIERGIKITRGQAFAAGKSIGSLTLDSGPPPFQFILAIPQYATEEVLEARFFKLAEGSSAALHRGTHVIGLRQREDHVTVLTAQGASYDARFAVGCDGQYSTVRKQLDIDFPGGPYPDTYVMGDFEDQTDLGPDAAVFLTRSGLVESFPLPGGVRRWVARTDSFIEHPQAEEVAAAVAAQLDVPVAPPDAATATMASGFRVFRHLATRMHSGRVLLAGDAAHVVSPIGGQGMNVGWLDGRDAAAVLFEALAGGDYRRPFAEYSRKRLRVARRAARRAEFNMMFGRPGPFAPVARFGARLMLSRPLAGFFARQFTMRGL